MSPVNSRKKALVVAVSDYDENSSLNKLPFCKKDGDEMLALLKDLGYEIKNLDGLVGYVDGRLMQDCVYEFFKDDDIKSDDTILFYFSGHGVPGDDDFFLASSNIDPRRPKMRGFSFADLNGEITHCRAKRVVVILDSCYAGSLDVSGKSNESALASAAKNQMSVTFKEGEGRCLLSSCMGFQESFATAEGDHSFFTNYLLKGLRGAEGKSVDDNGIVTPESLMNYIDHEIDNLKEKVQTPFRKIESAGKIALADHSNTLSKPARVPLGDTDSIDLADAFYKMGLEMSHSSKKREEVDKLLDKALALNPTNSLASSLKGRMRYDSGEYGEAVKYYDKALKINPKDVQIWLSKGESLYNLNQKDEALKCYEMVLELEPGDERALMGRGKTLAALEKYDEAMECYDKLLKMKPKDAWMWHTKILVLYKMNKSDEAEKCIGEILAIPANEVWELKDKASVLEKLGRYRDAIECHEKIIGTYPKMSRNSWLDKGRILEQLQENDSALRCYDKVLESGWDVRAWQCKAELLGKLGRYEDAISYYDKIIERDSANVSALSGKGDALYKIQKYEESIKCYEKILKINPKGAQGTLEKIRKIESQMS